MDNYMLYGFLCKGAAESVRMNTRTYMPGSSEAL